jgi:hypothetical protein
VRILVVRLRCEREQSCRRLDQPRRERQFAAQPVHFTQVVLERQRRLGTYGVLQGSRVDKRIAVAITANPRTGAQERRERGPVDPEVTGKTRTEIGIETRNLLEKRVAIVGEAVFDLVLHLQLGQPNHRRLPKLEHLPVERRLELGRLFRRQRDAIPPDQQPGDFALRVQYAFCAAPLWDARSARATPAHRRTSAITSRR